MAARFHLAVVAYDVADDREREKLSRCLEDYMTRVQDSLFEAWMTKSEAQRVFQLAAAIAGNDASVRLYMVPGASVRNCEASGFPPAPSRDGALIL